MGTRLALLGCALIAAVGAVTACGSDGDGLFGLPASGAEEGEGGETPSTGAGSDGGSTGKGGASASSSAQSSSSDASSSDASSSSGGNTEPQIPCGGAICMGDQICCASYSGFSQHCAASGACNTQSEYQIDCNNQFDCEGNDVCCAYYDDFYNTFVGVQCVASCESPEQGVLAVLMCQDDAAICPNGTTCTDSVKLPPEYSYCMGE